MLESQPGETFWDIELHLQKKLADMCLSEQQ